MLHRRDFLTGAAAVAGLAGSAQASAAHPPFRYAYSAISWETNIEDAIAAGARLGFPGVEPFRQNVVNYLGRPLALKKILDDHNMVMASASNGGGPDFSGNFFDPAKQAKTVADHIAYVRDFIVPFGTIDHFKMNMGERPPGYEVSDDNIKVCADSLNRIGEAILKMGVRLAPHPHVGSLIEIDHEARLLMTLTDPRYVWCTADTSHLTLGGIDPLQFIKDYWPRVAEIHYKDAPRRLRGNKVLAVPKSGPEAGGHHWFRSMREPDSGGVDFPAIQKFLVEKNYKGWVIFDYDASMVPAGGSMEALLKTDIGYLVEVLGVDPALFKPRIPA